MSDRELEERILERLPTIAAILRAGHDVELRESADGIRVIELRKTVIK